MLGKLLKYEFKATARLLVPLYLVLICITVVNRLLLRFDVSGLYAFIDMFLIFIYVLSIISIVIVSFVLMIIRFYKNLMTDEGYLMFTLPVKTYDLINSKLLVTLFWTLLSVLSIFVSLFIVFATHGNMNEMWNEINQIFTELHATFGGSLAFLIIDFIILIIMGSVANILSIYASIAIGQLFNGHKLIGSFAAYIGIYTALQIVMTIMVAILVFFNMDNLDNGSGFVTQVYTFSNVASILLCVLFYTITNQILKKKLNLD